MFFTLATRYVENELRIFLFFSKSLKRYLLWLSNNEEKKKKFFFLLLKSKSKWAPVEILCCLLIFLMSTAVGDVNEMEKKKHKSNPSSNKSQSRIRKKIKKKNFSDVYCLSTSLVIKFNEMIFISFSIEILRSNF